MEETVGTLLGLLCTVAPCLLFIGAIVGGIVFFANRRKKAAPGSATTAVTAAPPSHSTAAPAAASVQSASLGQEQSVMAGESLAPSEVVALRGELFASSAGVLNSWQVVGREMKVSGPPLAQNMLAVAFLAMEQAGDARLVQDKKKATLGLREVDTLLVVPTGQSSNWPAGSMEARIIASANTRQASGRNNVKDIVNDVLEKDAGLVWDWALRLAHNSMANRGLLNAEVKKGILSSGLAHYSLTPAANAALAESNPAEIQQLLQSCQTDRPAFFQLLNKEIKQGFDSRKEASSSDSGGPDLDF